MLSYSTEVGHSIRIKPPSEAQEVTVTTQKWNGGCSRLKALDATILRHESDSDSCTLGSKPQQGIADVFRNSITT